MRESLQTALATSIPIVGIAGGGGSSGGGGGGGGGSSFSSSSSSDGSSSGTSDPVTGAIFGIIFVVVFIAIFISSIAAGRKLQQRRARLKAEIAAAAAADIVWDEQKTRQYVKETFMKHQQDWSSFNIESMKTYMTPDYLHHTELMLAALKQMNRQNQVKNIVIITSEFVDIDDETDNAKDNFDIVISAKVDDVIFDTKANQILHQQNLMAVQTYHFVRSGNTWLISGLSQSTASQLTYTAALEAFAKKNQFYYSQDWGWLLLPQRGQLFGPGKFGISDINNHVIGIYNDLLIQLYSYKPNPAGSTANYLIAQASLPKSYGDIVVRRKQTLMNTKIRGLNKLSTEWGDFNKKYDVFASDTEQATSFELLNPTFMQQLEALPFEVSIEVVDNVVYLYGLQGYTASLQTGQESAQYETMLAILKAAFKEMRM